MNIKDLKFDPQYTDEEYSAAIDWLKTARDSFGAVANFAIIKTGGSVEPFPVRGCHGAIVYPNTANGKRVLVVTENGMNRRCKEQKKGDVELREPFLKWFLYESFASRFILNRDDYEYCRNHGFVFSADMPCLLLVNCLIISRHFYELNDAAFEAFNEFSKTVPGSVAYSLAMNTGLSQGKTYLTTNIYSHRAWAIWFTLDAMRNFVNGEFGPTLTDDPTKHYRNFATLSGGSLYCTDLKPGTMMHAETGHFVKKLLEEDEEFKETLSAYRKKGTLGKVVEVINPFTRPSRLEDNVSSLKKKQPWLTTFEETRDVLLPYLSMHFNEACSISTEQPQPVKEIILV